MLNEEQRAQIEKQVQAHARAFKYTVDVPVGDSSPVLRDLLMYPGVLQPQSSGEFGRYLHDHPDLVAGKRVLDMGAGSGALGVIMALAGAREVVLADLQERCCKNSAENVDRFGVADRCRVVQSDLFQNLSGTFDLIVFAHPYFEGSPELGMPVTIGMFAEPATIRRFLIDAKKLLAGAIMMPYFHLAGEANDPAVQGPAAGYRVEVVDRRKLGDGLQRGDYSVYRLMPNSSGPQVRE